ncbi:MAG: hypothetical protein DWQ04_17280 [Chloroflexi bacterium]|nr:MAG: hypothetical protein DWQ04_17280 [Chloroflexota bacterium]
MVTKNNWQNTAVFSIEWFLENDYSLFECLNTQMRELLQKWVKLRCWYLVGKETGVFTKPLVSNIFGFKRPFPAVASILPSQV